MKKTLGALLLLAGCSDALPVGKAVIAPAGDTPCAAQRCLEEARPPRFVFRQERTDRGPVTIMVDTVTGHEYLYNQGGSNRPTTTERLR